MTKPDLQISYRDPRDLKPRAQNPRTHSPKQIKQIAASIKEFGFISPVLVDRGGGIIAGHGRVEAAKLIGMADVPTVRVDHLSPAQIRAYVIADNKLAENAGWDRELLALELQELSVELNFDVTITGFETAEVDLIIGDLSYQTPDEADQVPEVDRSVPAVSRPGDRWHIGDHVLLCGDSLKRQSYAALLGSQRAEMVFTDPPYNVPIDGHVSGKGHVRHREFAMASGEMTTEEFTQFLATAFEHFVAFSRDGSIHFVCMDWRHMREVLDAAKDQYDELKNLCVWSKTNAGMGSLYRSQHELVFVFKNGSAPHVNNVELGRFGRNRTNIWTYAGANTFGSDRDAELVMHPTVKPVAMVADAILDCSKRNGIILDAFGGSGSTLIAAERTGRRGYGIELDPYYVDTIIRRFAEVCGIKAAHGNPADDKDIALVAGIAKAGSEADEAVGPGQPPKRTRFPKGVSGNPKGRPKGSRNLETIFKEAANSEVTAVIDGRARKITKVQAAVMQLATKASQGERELGKFLDWVDEFEARAAAARPAQFPLEERDVEVLRAAYERMKQCNPDGATE